MDYQFTVLTLGQKITSMGSATDNTGQTPWSNLSRGTVIPMPGATLSTITVSDDDARFQSGRYNPDATGQTLTANTSFGPGTTLVPAGTALSFHTYATIRTPNGNGFDDFMAIFPRRHEAGVIGQELGNRHAVLLIPVARADGTYPVFSLSKTYTYNGMTAMGRANDSAAYGPPAAGVPCFGQGTLIDTETGPRRVEALRPGDLILTRDHGPQALRWQGGAHISAEGLEMRPNLRPILIRKGALGAGSPGRDLVVSPQHRILVRSRIAHRLFQDGEILVAAKHLAGLPGIEVIVPPKGVTYLHLLFDRHEIVLSNGAWSESLYTGPQALKSVSDAARREILALFPELVHGTPPAPARRLLTGREAQQLAERQSRNLDRRSLVEPL